MNPENKRQFNRFGRQWEWAQPQNNQERVIEDPAAEVLPYIITDTNVIFVPTQKLETAFKVIFPSHNRPPHIVGDLSEEGQVHEVTMGDLLIALNKNFDEKLFTPTVAPSQFTEPPQTSTYVQSPSGKDAKRAILDAYKALPLDPTPEQVAATAATFLDRQKPMRLRNKEGTPLQENSPKPAQLIYLIDQRMSIKTAQNASIMCSWHDKIATHLYPHSAHIHERGFDQDSFLIMLQQCIQDVKRLKDAGHDIYIQHLNEKDFPSEINDQALILIKELAEMSRVYAFHQLNDGRTVHHPHIQMSVQTLQREHDFPENSKLVDVNISKPEHVFNALLNIYGTR